MSKGEATREKILETAAELINRKGFGATSINDLLGATGLKKGSLYFHFSGKEALGLAILEKARDGFLTFLDMSLSGATPGEKLDNFLNKVMRTHKKSGFVGGCIFGNTALEMGDAESGFAGFIEKVFEEWVERLRTVVAAAQDSGEVASDLSADVLAGHMVAAIEGGIMLARLKKDEKPLRDALTAVRVLLQR
ncbi:TetR/AcrR family transcriptional regulator [Geobacter argillaceus]|uniref:TetR family transcriptional regulator n=1 Tax=Geobacter argillaceus TaxID=345631 RepID=A0A562V687_9BACT|nr:TetR/AcrR family transcriptional regulator [Geobacter argillaceus]TWJ13406.1 TetR family transcriptional regulator [Geobacter argillaceus]